jgi:hypothetical protein
MTTGFQFAHVDFFSIKGATKQNRFTGSHGTQRGRGWSVSDILAELDRKPGHCGHVQHPAPPRFFVGGVADVEAAVTAWSASQSIKVRLKSGKISSRKMRSDAPSMAAGVISFPKDREQEWPEFRVNAIDELKEKYGDRLRCVAEHLDETHPHLHFYLVPRPGEAFGVVHDGYAASREARKQPGNKIRTAFQDAMRGWQDWVSQKIGTPFALARIGPARARSDRKAWKKDEIDRLEERAKAVNEAGQAAIAVSEKFKAKLADLERREMLMDKKRDALDNIHANRTAELAKKLADQAKTQSELDRLVKENAKTNGEIVQLFDSMTEAQKLVIQKEQPKIAEIIESDAKIRSKRPRMR